jgi:signal transduction histidine kinase
MTEPGPDERTVLDRLPEAVVEVDRDGRIRAANDRARRLLGVGGATAGRPLAELVAVEDLGGLAVPLPPPPPRVGDRLAESIVRVRRPDGRWCHLAVAGRWNGGGWTLTWRPAGARMALERRQGDVVATVAHELRSPLASVRGFTRTLLGRWERFDDAQRRALLEAVDRDAERITGLLTDLLEVARIDAHRVPLRWAPIDVEELIAATVAEVSRREDATGRQLQVELAPGIGTIQADRDRLVQVLVNLLDNALRYAPEGPIVVSASGDGSGVRITVQDHGPGIEPHLRGEVFRKFGRGRDRRRSGTGLGLYISRGLVTAHGGRMWLEGGDERPAESALEPVGAVFHVWLPRQRRGSASSPVGGLGA